MGQDEIMKDKIMKDKEGGLILSYWI